MNKEILKLVLKEREFVLVFGIISLVMDIVFYFGLKHIILNSNFNDVPRNIAINFKTAFQMAQSIGYWEVAKKCFIGTFLLLLLIYLTYNSACKYLWETRLNVSDVCWWIIIVVYLSNIILTSMMLKYLLIVWAIVVGSSFYAATHSKAIS